MTRTWRYIVRGIIALVITGIAAVFILPFHAVVSQVRKMDFGPSLSAAAPSPVDVHASASLSATVAPNSWTYFDETFTLDTGMLKNGNGRRSVFTASPTSFKLDGIDDVTDGRPARVATASVERNGEANVIKWSFTPKSGIRSFVLRYKVNSAVRTYADGGSLFNWTFFDKRNPLLLSNYTVTLRLPGGATVGPNAFSHSGASIQDLESSGTTLTWDAGTVASSQIVELLVQFNAGFMATTSGSASQVAGEVRQQETASASERVAKPDHTVRDWLPIALALITLIGFALAQYMTNREYKVRDAPMYERDLPTPETPAEVGWLMRLGTIAIDDLTATIVDLARRRFLKIQDFPLGSGDVKLTRTLDKAKGDPAAHESPVLEWLFAEESVQFSELKAACTSNPTAFREAWTGFTKGVNESCKSKGFLEALSGLGFSIAAKMIGGGLVLFGIPIGIFFGPRWIALSLVGAVMLTFSSSSPRRSRVGAETWAKWDAFRRYIHDFGTLKDVPPAGVVMWEEYLAYAIVLGEGDTVLKYMKLRPPSAVADAWYPEDLMLLSTFTASMTEMDPFTTFASSIDDGGGSGSSDSGFSDSSFSSGSFDSGGGGGFDGGGGASFD